MHLLNSFSAKYLLFTIGISFEGRPDAIVIIDAQDCTGEGHHLTEGYEDRLMYLAGRANDEACDEKATAHDDEEHSQA